MVYRSLHPSTHTFAYCNTNTEGCWYCWRNHPTLRIHPSFIPSSLYTGIEQSTSAARKSTSPTLLHRDMSAPKRGIAGPRSPIFVSVPQRAHPFGMPPPLEGLLTVNRSNGIIYTTSCCLPVSLTPLSSIPIPTANQPTNPFCTLYSSARFSSSSNSTSASLSPRAALAQSCSL